MKSGGLISSCCSRNRHEKAGNEEEKKKKTILTYVFCVSVFLNELNVHSTFPQILFYFIKLDVYFYEKLIRSSAHSSPQLSFNCVSLPSFLQNYNKFLLKR